MRAALVAWLATTQAQVHKLRLHPHEPPGRRRRRATARAAAAGAELYEGLWTHYVHLYVGTPPQKTSVIVDTGSSLAAMPCADCSGCGKHKTGARFDPSRPGATTVDCHHPPTNMRCNGCGSGNKCGYSVSYTEGSSISGQG